LLGRPTTLGLLALMAVAAAYAIGAVFRYERRVITGGPQLLSSMLLITRRGRSFRRSPRGRTGFRTTCC
jgi:hypothetical protein